MTRKITKSNQSEQRSDRGAKRSDRGGAYSGAPALHHYALFSHMQKKRLFHDGIPLIFLKFEYKKNCNHHS